MFKSFIILFSLAFNSNLYSQEVAEQALARLPSSEMPSDATARSSENASESPLKSFEGSVRDDLYTAILEDTEMESFARTLEEAFKSDFITARGLNGRVSYYFEVDSSEKITYARLQVRSAIVEKELKLDETLGVESLVTKLPAVEERKFFSPIKVERISSQFNLARKHPVKRRKILPHNGVDFTARSGTPIYPAQEGVVKIVARSRSKGKYVVISHFNGMQSTYVHMRAHAKGLRVGDYVDVGDKIGEVGRTGYATGSHLHFGLINQEGFYVNPILYLKDYQINPNESQEVLDSIDLIESLDSHDSNEAVDANDSVDTIDSSDAISIE